MSATEYEARVAGVEYLFIAIGFPAYAVGSLIVFPGPLVGRIIPALGLLALLVVVSVRTPWSCRVGPLGVVLHFWAGGLVQRFLPKERIRVVIAMRSDWRRKTHDVRLTSSHGLLRLVRWTTIANARFGVSEDHSRELLAALRGYGYDVDDAKTAP